jgi:hypothetical protein
MPQTDQYPISDFLNWIDEKTVILNADFQRRSVWPPAAKVFLIDTILRNRPMPNIYMRTKTDLGTRRAYREVVDGQQRLRAIHDFGSDKLVLTGKAKEFTGQRYSDLDDEYKTKFLTYTIGTVQLFNISDNDVLDIFQRINAYGLRLNPQEVRHGKFQGNFRDAVIDAAKRWETLWDVYGVVGLRDRVRMSDDQLMAEMLGIILEGVTDGGQPRINRLYQRYDEDLPRYAMDRIDTAIKFLLQELSPILQTGLSRGPHFLMLFAAVSHALFGIPEGGIGDEMPSAEAKALSDIDLSLANLGLLADTLQSEDDDVPKHLLSFRSASSTSTQRIRGRKIRFLALYNALLPSHI